MSKQSAAAYASLQKRPRHILDFPTHWLATPVITTHNSSTIEPHAPRTIYVVRDDLLPGGTKRRALARWLPTLPEEEFVYATPAYGYAQIALTYACRDLGRRATVFVAKRGVLHARTAEAGAAGAQVVQVPHGYLNVVQARARAYCAETGARYLPWGLDCPEFSNALEDVARAVALPGGAPPREVWTVAGSGTLTRALQAAWPEAQFYAVQVGAAPNVGKAVLLKAPEKYEQGAQAPPPFPSCDNYDAKAWQFVQERASDGALFWNVGA